MDELVSKLETLLKKKQNTLGIPLKELIDVLESKHDEIRVSKEWIERLVEELRSASSPSPVKQKSSTLTNASVSKQNLREKSMQAVPSSPVQTRSAAKTTKPTKPTKPTATSTKTPTKKTSSLDPASSSSSSSRSGSRSGGRSKRQDDDSEDSQERSVVLTPLPTRRPLRWGDDDYVEGDSEGLDDEGDYEEEEDEAVNLGVDSSSTTTTTTTNVIAPRGGNYTIMVRGWWEGSGDLWVDLAHKDQPLQKENLVLKLEALQTSKPLDGWASGVLGVVCASKVTRKDNLKVIAAEMSNKYGHARLPPKEIGVFGRQTINGGDVFALSSGLVLSLESGEVLDDGHLHVEFPRSLLNLSIAVPRNVSGDDNSSSMSGDDSDLSSSSSSSSSSTSFLSSSFLRGGKGAGALKEWIKCWDKKFSGEHLEELIIGIAHSAMCMKRTEEKPMLIYYGRSDCGKTQLMSFLAEMFGFHGRKAMLASVTESALWDHLHYLSGLPTFCNDAKWETKQVRILRDHIIPIYDGSTHSMARKMRTANGHVVASLNDKSDSIGHGNRSADGPFEKLLGQESNVNRLILCPVRDLTGEGFVVTTNWRPSTEMAPPAAVLSELLSIAMVPGTEVDGRFPGRLGKHHGALKYYVKHVCTLAKLPQKKQVNIDRFIKEHLEGAMKQYQLGAVDRRAELRDEAVAEFKQLMQQRFFLANGSLVAWASRKCQVQGVTGLKLHPMIQTHLKNPQFYHVRLRELYNELCDMREAGRAWKARVPSVELLIKFLGVSQDGDGETGLLEPEKNVQAESKDGKRNGGSVKMRRLHLEFEKKK